MAEFRLPPNSRIDRGAGKIYKAPAGARNVRTFRVYRFDPHSGVIDSVRAEARGRTVGKNVVMTPWEGRWSDYAERDGVRVPTRGEVAWPTPEGRRAYWRGEVTGITYESATRAR